MELIEDNDGAPYTPPVKDPQWEPPDTLALLQELIDHLLTAPEHVRHCEIDHNEAVDNG